MRLKAIIQAKTINRNFHKNFHLIVLWCRTVIQIIPQKNHHAAQQISNCFSLILRLCLIDFHLSIHRMMNVTILIINKYIMTIF